MGTFQNFIKSPNLRINTELTSYNTMALFPQFRIINLFFMLRNNDSLEKNGRSIPFKNTCKLMLSLFATGLDQF